MSWQLKLGTCIMVASFLADAVTAAQSQPVAPQNQKLRPAGVAGAFYPADPATLSAMMDEMLARASVPEIDGQIVAAVVPHAGYPYSGPVAAFTYAALKGRKYERVVVIAPSHYAAFDFSSVYDGDGYVTPLGVVPVDKVFVRELAKSSTSIQLSEHGHKAGRQGAEHALEVELPWLQHVLGSFTLVPIVMGDQSYESSRALGIALAELIQGAARDAQQPSGETLIVASSDLSHYHSYDAARSIDHRTLSALEAWDYLSMSRNFESRAWEACGGGPVIAAMIAAERLGANRAQVLEYANSGDVTGDRSQVVGYSADIFVKTSEATSGEHPFSLNEEEKTALLASARKSVERAVLERMLYESVESSDDALNQERGAFVTLRETGNLRGCVGYISAIKPLYKTISETAALAALRDPRFKPVTAEELPRLEYEISVLSPLAHVLDVGEIEVGRDGLLIKNGGREGLLLPQVPIEQHWDRGEFLDQTCVKAGLRPSCWKDKDTDIFRFQALVFGEQKPAVTK